MTEVVLNDLIDFINMVTYEDYIRKSPLLSGASIGQHCRHSIELYQCLINGYAEGKINYEKRKRDILIETDKEVAINSLLAIEKSLPLTDKAMLLECEGELFQSSFQRELLYCNEHTIHHKALIRVGVNEIGGYLLPESFGVAPSTLRYRKFQCAQ